MTQVYFSKPYPDELVYSVAARYCEPLGLSLAKLSRMLCGRAGMFSVDFPCYVASLANATECCWGKSSDQILTDHSLLPLYTNFLPTKRRVDCWKAAKDVGYSSAHMLAGQNAASLARLIYLRHCPLCAEEDIRKFGETYWHRIHNVPGTIACPRHKIRLLNSADKYRQKPYRIPTSANSSWTAITSAKANIVVPVIDGHPSIRQAEMVAEMLNGQWPQVAREELTSRYLRMGAERGFCDQRLEARYWLLAAAIVERNGIDYLDEIGVIGILGPNGHYGSFSRMITKTSGNYMAHVLLEDLLDATPTNSGPIPGVGHGPWFCPSRFCTLEHREPLAILGSVATGPRPALRAACRCGYKFTFDHVDDGVPIPRRVSQFGEGWKSAAIDLHGQGRSLNQISSELNVSQDTVRKLLRAPGTQRKYSEAEVEECRRLWCEARAAQPNREISKARHAVSGIYMKLYRMDREWLRDNCADRKKGPNRKMCRVDHSTREVEYLSAVDLAKDRLMQRQDGVRVTKTLLLREAGINDHILNSAHYQRFKAHVEEISESKETYWNRRLKYAREVIISSGESLTPSSLIRHAGLNLYRMKKESCAIAGKLIDKYLDISDSH